jgi:F0F1-type ATP synthase assembly protein I
LVPAEESSTVLVGVYLGLLIDANAISEFHTFNDLS